MRLLPKFSRLLCLGLMAGTALAADPAVTVIGVTEPLMDVIISSPTQGIVHERKYEEGSEVKKGDTILELDSTLERLEAQRRHEVAERNRTDYEATKTLFERTKSVSKEELDKKNMEYQVSVAEEQIAEEQLKRRTIVAPFDGTIVELYLQPGAGCEPYQPLLRLVQTKQCYFVGHVEGKQAAMLKLGQTVQIQVEGGQKVPGKISFIAPVADSASGLVRVKATFANPEGKIRPGLAAQMVIE